MTDFFCWIFPYFAVHGILSACACPMWITAVVTAVYTVCLAVRFFRKTPPTLHADAFLKAVPLFVFAAANVVFLRGVTFSAAWVCAICGAVAEELLFRGLLITALEKKNVHIAVWGSAIVFGAYHLIGGGYVQALCAVCFGFALAAYACRFRAVLPCVAAHLLTNAFGNSNVPVWVLLLCCVICGIYGCWLYFNMKEN